MHPLLLLVIACGVFIAELVRRRRYRSLKHIRGPPVPSWVFGHDFMFTRQEEVGQYDFAWLAKYGPTWRTSGHLGAKQLMTADPKAMQHILHKSGYGYPKRWDLIKASEIFAGGPGITSVAGEVHQQQCKIMNPTFSSNQLRGFLPLFQSVGGKLCDKWEKEVIATPDKTVSMNKWLARTTLDIIGAAAFDYDYGALDQTDNALLKSYSTLFVDTLSYPSKFELFFRTVWYYLPDWVLNIMMRAPSRMLKRVASTSRLFQEVTSNLLKEKESEIHAKAEEGHKDVLSILEMKAQMQTLTFVGHKMTASTVSWLFWELAKNLEYQLRLRDEIRAARADMRAHGDIQFSVDDLESMTVMNNTIKRCAAKDDVVPLQILVIGTTGETIDAIPIKAGHLLSVWGDDGNVWNPDHFLQIDPTKQMKLGSMLTFCVNTGPLYTVQLFLVVSTAASAGDSRTSL
ncbi:cytochrome P450 [Fomes fomentarius]|nr:cytochrome P450 [Fomes fomentarius]